MVNNVDLLSVKNLKTYIFMQKGIVKAVDGVSFNVKKGKTLGLVGESGSGKSMTAYSIMSLLPSKNIKIVGGSVYYRTSNSKAVNLINLNEKQMKRIRGEEIALVFQDSLSCLNPVYTIGDQIIENIICNLKVSKKQARDIALDFLVKVKMSEPTKRINQYPFELSGGMRQRAMIAIALSANPRVIIADEPMSALDVTIKAQILDLFKEIKCEKDMGIIHITHDMGVMAQTADDIAVMYLGDLMECTSVYNIFENAKHPYTIKLLESIIRLGSRGKSITPIQGSIPSFLNINPGCKFYSRCPKKIRQCEKQIPPLINIKDNNHYVKCWLYA